MNPHEEFEKEVRMNIEGLKGDLDLQALSRVWVREVSPHKYAYNFKWMGRPIIQFPQDMMAMQEILWTVKPDLVIEAGVAHGGSLLYYASLLELMGNGEVLGIDIDIRQHNREAIEAHPMSRRVRLLQGSSTAPETIEQVRALALGKRAVVVLDSCLISDSHVRTKSQVGPFAHLKNPVWR